MDQALTDGVEGVWLKHVVGPQVKALEFVGDVALQVVVQRVQLHQLAPLHHLAHLVVLAVQQVAQLGLCDQQHAHCRARAPAA